MKKAFSLFLSVVCLATFSFCLPSTSRFSLKLSGGIGYFSVGELNSTLESMSDYDYLMASNVSGRWEKMHGGMNFRLEAVYLINERLGIGLGGGFFRVSKEDKMHKEYSSSLDREDETYTRTIGCVPLTLNIHYMVPLASTLNLSLSGGAGYYLTSFQFKTDLVELTPKVTNRRSEVFDPESKGTIGFQGSFGLEMMLTKNVGFFVVARGWYASITGLTGEMSGNSVENNVPDTAKASDVGMYLVDFMFREKKYTKFIFFQGPPEDPNAYDLRIDLSGFSLGAGIRFSF